MSDIKLGWGLDSTGQMKHIANVTRGKECGCVCPDCGTPLIARHGEVMAWHFAHAMPVECSGESALHRAAKDVLEKAAFEGREIFIPHTSGEVKGRDIANIVQTELWNYGDVTIPMNGAAQEVYLASDLITDVLVGKCDGEQLAVEIYVTHEKDEIDIRKFEQWGHDSIEIDLSSLPWNADHETILEAVLTSAPRKWLFSQSLEPTRKAASDKLHERVTDINSQYQARLDIAVKQFQKSRNLDSLHYMWPTLQRNREAEDDAGAFVHAVAETTPRITSLGEEWVRTDGGWKTTGVVNNKTEANVLFVISGYSGKRDFGDRPALMVKCHINVSDKDDGASYTLDWVNVKKWYVKLERQAESRLKIKLEKANTRIANTENFARSFRQMTDEGRMRVLANKLSISPPSWQGKLNEVWNTSWSVWKSLVWLYKIRKFQGDTVSVQYTATDEWLEKLLEWPNDNRSIEIRSKNLWFWFKELEKAGYLRHQGRQWFEIENNLPDDFQPWMRL